MYYGIRASSEFARLVSSRGGAFAKLARPRGRALANPGCTRKLIYLNFKMFFNLESHNFKADSESVYKWLLLQLSAVLTHKRG